MLGPPAARRAGRRPAGRRGHRRRAPTRRAVRRRSPRASTTRGRSPAYLVLAAALVALSVIDLEHFLLPNRIVYPLAVAMLVLLAARPRSPTTTLGAIGRGLLAGVVAFAVFFVLHSISPRSMGFGDVKLVVRARPVARLARLGRGGARPVPRLPLRRGDRHRPHRHQLRARRTRPAVRAVPRRRRAHRHPRRRRRSSTGTAGADAPPASLVSTAAETQVDEARWHRDRPPVSGSLIRVLRYLTAGESHGPALTVVVEGLPAGLPVTVEQIGDELARRRLGFGRGPADALRARRRRVPRRGPPRRSRSARRSSIVIHNTEWPKWQEEMSPAPGVTEKPLHQPRPGHADLVGMQKYGFDDARNVLERASARETAARVAAGTLAKLLLAELGTEVISHVIQMGAARADGRPAARPPPTSPTVDDSPVRCFDPAAEAAMIAEVEAAAKVGDSLGGVVEVLGYGVPPGPRLARPLGPQDRRAARAGAHEHPGDEGRRDRRRLRGRRPARQRGARRDPLGRRRRRVRARRRRARAAPRAA